MDDILSYVGRRHDCQWLAGGNIDLLNAQGKAEEYVSKLASCGLQNAINGPTRITQKTTRAIDHVFYRVARAEVVQVETLDSSGLSDHMMIWGTIRYSRRILHLNRGVMREKISWVKFSEGLLELESQEHSKGMTPEDRDYLYESSDRNYT